MEVEGEIMENVGKREILQNTEREQHEEDTAQDGVAQKCDPAEVAEDQKASEKTQQMLHSRSNFKVNIERTVKL